MSVNNLCINGMVCTEPRFKKSPAGVLHLHFVLEHRSQQQEGDFERSVYCRLRVVSIEPTLLAEANVLTIGANITINGFMIRKKNKLGLKDLVLHAKEICLHEGEN